MEPAAVKMIPDDLDTASCRWRSRSPPREEARVSVVATDFPDLSGLNSYVSDLWEPSRWPGSERLIFATAQHQPDLPDVAVAIALAAHLNAAPDLKGADIKERFTVVMLPRYLQADQRLAAALNERGGKVKEAYVIGEYDAVSNSLRELLKAMIVPLDTAKLLQAIREIIVNLLAVLVPVAVVLLAAKSANDFLESQGYGRWQWTKLPQLLWHALTPPQARTISTTTSETTDTTQKETGSLRKYARVRLKSPPRWVVGSWPDRHPSAWPAAQVEALHLTGIVEADPDTGVVGLQSKGQPIMRSEEVIVPWSEVQFLEFADDPAVWKKKTTKAQPPGPTTNDRLGAFLHDLIQEFATAYWSSHARRSHRPH